MTRKFLNLSAFLIIVSLSLKAQSPANIQFIENKGQWDQRVKFRADAGPVTFFLREAGYTILQQNTDDFMKMQEYAHGHRNGNSRMVLRSHAFNVDFVGASSNYEVVTDQPLATYNNYFYGNDPSKWAGNCRIYEGITVKNIYPNIDLRYYTESGQLKYDIVARPGADISKIGLKYEGADDLSLYNNELHIITSTGVVKELAPYTYQVNGNTKKEINCSYVLKNNILRFDISRYERQKTLVIDPTLIFSSLSGSTANNWGFTATYGPDGSFFGGGIVFGGNSFPLSTGAFQTSFQGGEFDMGIIKLSPDGTNMIYATYIGGSGDDQATSLIADPQGELILVGRTNSPLSGNGSYPVTGGLIGACGGYDIIVTRLNVDGTALTGSRRIGGTGNDGVNIKLNRVGPSSLETNYGDDGRCDVMLDNAGNIYVASCSRSNQSGTVNGFPSPGAFQTSFGGGSQDAVILKLSPDLSNLLFASYLGGNDDDAAYSLSIKPGSDEIYVAGGTASSDFPGNKTGTIGTSSQGIDGFVAVITGDGTSIVRSTYLGTSGTDQVFGVKFDDSGFPYIMGQSTASWPIINAPYNIPGAKQFIAKLQPDLSAYIYSTVFGAAASNPKISPTAFMVDHSENVYVSGWGGSISPTDPSPYPTSGTIGLPVTPDALKSSTDGRDFYFFVLKRNAQSQLYGSFFGQDGGFGDHSEGTSRFDPNGILYQAMCANCGGGVTFPTTPGVWAPTKSASAFCNLAMVKLAFNLSDVFADIRTSINGVAGDTSGCIPLVVDFSDQIHNAKSYEWNFGDGSPQVTSTAPAITHTYNATGTYNAFLIAIDSSTNNKRDTSYITIKATDGQANIDFNIAKLSPCTSLNYQFNNTSTAPASILFSNTSFIWDFGDGSRDTTGTGSIIHQYSGPGTYIVKLILADEAYCNGADSIITNLSVSSSVTANFQTPPGGCIPYTAVFVNTSTGSQQFEWNFGDGASTTDISPTHVYNLPGTYAVRLIARDPASCNMADTIIYNITVAQGPVADAGADTAICSGNTATIGSPAIAGNTYLWSPADGLSSTSTAQTNSTPSGTTVYTLTVTNSSGCETKDDVTVVVMPIPPKPSISLTGIDTLQSSAASGNQWFLDGIPVTGATSDRYAPDQAGIYTVRVTINGCSSEISDEFDYAPIVTGGLVANISLAPNPVTETLHIEYLANDYNNFTVVLFDMAGRKLQSGSFARMYNLDMKRYSTGLYIVHLINNETKEKVAKMVLKQP